MEAHPLLKIHQVLKSIYYSQTPLRNLCFIEEQAATGSLVEHSSQREIVFHYLFRCKALANERSSFTSDYYKCPNMSKYKKLVRNNKLQFPKKMFSKTFNNLFVLILDLCVKCSAVGASSA